MNPHPTLPSPRYPSFVQNLISFVFFFPSRFLSVLFFVLFFRLLHVSWWGSVSVCYANTMHARVCVHTQCWKVFRVPPGLDSCLFDFRCHVSLRPLVSVLELIPNARIKHLFVSHLQSGCTLFKPSKLSSVDEKVCC